MTDQADFSGASLRVDLNPTPGATCPLRVTLVGYRYAGRAVEDADPTDCATVREAVIFANGYRAAILRTHRIMLHVMIADRLIAPAGWVQ